MKQELLDICAEFGYISAKNKSGLTLDNVLEIVANRGSIIPELQATLKCSKDTITKWIAKTFPDRHPTKDRSIYRFLLAKRNKKYCTRCETVRLKTEFYPNNSSSDNLQDYCIPCSKTYRRESYAKNPELELLRNSIRKNNNHTPKWANIEEILDFYVKRPDGHHVDHIVPLNGERVSGLNVLWNLQYLTIEENLKKGNKFLID